MAFPVILFNSSTGSDTAASGAGPGTALTGSAASTDGTGLIVTLDGSPDLSGVATDGSHVIFINDSTAGKRNFGKITAVDNGAKTVTVSDAFGLSISGKTWAIGGKRLTIASTTSYKLTRNNSTNGDAMPGWILRMESGYTETLTANYILTRVGNTTDGPIILEGDSAAATRPVLTFSNNGTAITSGELHIVRNFNLLNSNATKTASVGILTSGNTIIENMIIGDSVSTASSGKNFYRGISFGAQPVIYKCIIRHCSNIGVLSTYYGGSLIDCYIHHNLSHGYNWSSYGGAQHRIFNCIFAYNGGDGIAFPTNQGNVYGFNYTHILDCTIHGNTSAGIRCDGNTSNFWSFWAKNCNITANGSYGISCNGASVTTGFLKGLLLRISNCNFGTGATANTSGDTTSNANDSEIKQNCVNVDPQYTNASGDDFRVGTNVKALGDPLLTFGGGRSYVDIGALQRLEAGGIISNDPLDGIN